MRFIRSTAGGVTEYRADGESFRYVAKRVSKDRWALAMSKLETVAGIRVAVQGGPFQESWHDTLTTCKTVAAEFEALTDGYRSAEHGHRERYTEAVLKAYGQAVDQEVCATPADAGMITNAITDTDKGDSATMAENTAEATDHARIVEEINANIERAKSLAEADNAEALEELNTETETLISRLPARGKDANGQSWTAVKKELRNGFKAAAMVQEKPAEKKAATKKAEVAKKAEAAPVVTYDQFEGVPELVEMGAAQVVEGARLHIKTSTTAKDIAAIGLDMWRRMPNVKMNGPDILGDTDPAKKASTALKKAAGEALAATGDLDPYDVKTAVDKLWRSVQAQRTDVRAEYLRGLDADNEEAEEERKRFAAILKDKPEDVPVSKWIADHYGVSLKGQTELARERYHEKMTALTSGKDSGEGGEGEGGDDGEEKAAIAHGTPDEHLRALVARLKRDISSAKPDEFENASEEAKADVREDLENAQKAIKAMLLAVL